MTISRQRSIGIIIVASIILHVVLHWLGHQYYGDWTWQHLPFHASIEIAGSFIAFYVALLLLTLESRGEGTSFNVRIASALVGMGLLDGFHALLPPGQGFVSLHSIATFYGGILFSAVLLPDRFKPYFGMTFFVSSTAFAFTVGVVVLTVPEVMPLMVVDGRFTTAATFLNMVGGILLLCAAVKLYTNYVRFKIHDNLLFVLNCALFGLAAIMFQESKLWDLTWWGWHVLRFLAYGVALWFALTNEFTLQKELIKRKQDLEVDNSKKISELDSLAKEVEYQRDFYKVVLEGINESIIIIDTQGIVTYFNEKSEMLFGYEAEEVVGKNIAMLMDGATASEHDNYVKNSVLGHEIGIIGKDRELEAKHKLGKLFPIELKVAKIREGENLRFVGLLRDITARKENEKHIKEARDNAFHASKAKSEFLATMSHEIRTPLNGVIGMLNLLAKKRVDQDILEKINTANISAQSLLEIINDILDFSKIESGEMVIEAVDFNLQDIISNTVKAYSVNVHNKSLELILDLTEVDDLMVVGDPVRLRQVLSNLIGNAIKFTNEGEISIKASLKRNDQNSELLSLCVDVRDTGIGIAEENVKSVFESFKQADSSISRKFGGTGLGLAICGRLAELMGGGICVDSTLGVGSTFSFSVSLTESKKRKANAIEIESLGSMRVLVVDDNDVNRDILVSQLSLWGATAIAADSAESAISICNYSKAFDLQIIDLNMPDQNGLDLAKKLVSMKQHRNMVLLSSSITDIENDYLSELGFVGHLSKPLSPRSLNYLCQFIHAENEGKDFITESLLLAHFDGSPEVVKRENSDIHGHILLVEDNPINVEVAQNMLMDLHVSVETACNGVEATFKLLKSLAIPNERYSLILMDCQMPIMDGFETTKRIREGLCGKANTNIPIVALTANAIRGDREKCITAGMNDYLTKPIDERELATTLYKWLAVAAPDEVKRDDSPADNRHELMAWDKDGLMEKLRNREDRFKKLVEMFTSELSNRVNAIAQAVNDEDFDVLSVAAHTLKGVSANLKADQTAEYCRKIEEACSEKDIARARDLLAQLGDHAEVLLGEMKKAI